MVHDGHLEKQIEKHIGCMAGFLQIFDPLPGRQRRHRLLRTSPQRLPVPTASSFQDGGSTCSSPAMSEDVNSGKVSSRSGEIRSPVPGPEADTVSIKSTPKTPMAASPVFEFKDGGRLPWKFSKEAPRLSLDSRAVTDASGVLYPRDIRTMNHTEGLRDTAVGGGGDEEAQRRSPSVIARLMGLESLPSSDPNNPRCKMELRRSASDSRVNKEIYQFIEGGNYSCDCPRQGSVASVSPSARLPIKESVVVTRMNARREPEKSVAMQLQKVSVQRKSFYDTADFFPELNRSTQYRSLYEEIGKKLRMRGINEPLKDLDLPKQILEAMQLKGLLHFQNRRKGHESEKSPPVLMRTRNFSGRNLSKSQSPSKSPIRRGASTWDGSRANSPNGRRAPEEPKRAGSEQGRTPPTQSPRAFPARKAIPDHTMTYRTYLASDFAEEKVITIPAAEDEASTVSESSISTPSTQTDTEKSKLADGYKEGRTLLERCDKLLNSIAEITAASTAMAELQPSPVSVLDQSSLDGPPSRTQRALHFKDYSSVESVDEVAWSPVTVSVTTKIDHDEDNCDFLYVSDVVGASNYLPGDLDLFELLEKRWYLRGKDALSLVSRLHRKLAFDAVLEILDRKRDSLRWKHAPWGVSEIGGADPGQIWSDYRKIRQNESPSSSEGLPEWVHGVLRKDLAVNAADEWVSWPLETTESAGEIERLVFKELIGETIRDLAIPVALDYYDNKSNSGPRRKLAF